MIIEFRSLVSTFKRQMITLISYPSLITSAVVSVTSNRILTLLSETKSGSSTQFQLSSKPFSIHTVSGKLSTLTLCLKYLSGSSLPIG